jgi:hypothetical protein
MARSRAGNVRKGIPHLLNTSQKGPGMGFPILLGTSEGFPSRRGGVCHDYVIGSSVGHVIADEVGRVFRVIAETS